MPSVRAPFREARLHPVPPGATPAWRAGARLSLADRAAAAGGEVVERRRGALPREAAGFAARWVAPRAPLAIAGGSPPELLICDLAAGMARLRPEGLVDRVRSVAATPDGRIAISAGGGWQRTRQVKVPPSDERWARWEEARDGEYWPVPEALRWRTEVIEEPRDYRLWVWDVEECAVLRQIEGNEREVTSVAISADGQVAISMDVGGTVRCFRVDDGRPAGQWAVQGGFQVALEGRGAWALVGTRQGGLRRLDIERGEVTELLRSSGDPLDSVALSEDGGLAVSVTQRAGIRVWDVAEGRCAGAISGLPVARAAGLPAPPLAAGSGRPPLRGYQVTATPRGIEVMFGIGEDVVSWEIVG